MKRKTVEFFTGLLLAVVLAGGAVLADPADGEDDSDGTWWQNTDDDNEGQRVAWIKIAVRSDRKRALARARHYNGSFQSDTCEATAWVGGYAGWKDDADVCGDSQHGGDAVKSIDLSGTERFCSTVSGSAVWIRHNSWPVIEWIGEKSVPVSTGECIE